MEPIDPRKAYKLFEAARQIIPNIPNYDEFENALRDPVKRERIHGALASSNRISGFPDYETFSKGLSTPSGQTIQDIARTRTAATIDRPLNRVLERTPQGIAAPQYDTPEKIAADNSDLISKYNDDAYTQARESIAEKIRVNITSANPNFEDFVINERGFTLLPSRRQSMSPKVAKERTVTVPPPKPPTTLKEIVRDPRNTKDAIIRNTPESLQSYVAEFLQDDKNFNSVADNVRVSPGRGTIIMFEPEQTARRVINRVEKRGEGSFGDVFEIDNRDVAQITGRALADRTRKVGDQLRMAVNKLPQHLQEPTAAVAQALLAIERGEQIGITAEQALNQLPYAARANAVELAKLIGSYEQTRKDAETYMDSFPEEAQRLSQITQRKQFFNEIPFNSMTANEPRFMVEMGSQVIRGIGAAIDGVADMVGGLYGATKGLVAAATPGMDRADIDAIAGMSGFDYVVNKIGNAYDDHVRYNIETELFDKDGKLQDNNVVPAVISTAAQVALIYLSGGTAATGLSSVGVPARAAGMLGQTVSGYMFTVNDFYEEARKGQGLSQEDAMKYASAAATVQGLVESIAPVSFLRAAPKPSFTGALQAIRKGAITADDAFKYILRHEVPENVAEELIAMGAEAGVNKAANLVFDSQFDDEITKEDFMSTVLLSGASIGLLGLVRGTTTLTDEHNEYAKYLQKNKVDFEKWVIDGVTTGRISREEAMEMARYIDQMASPEAQARNVLNGKNPIAKQAEQLLGREKATYEGKSLTITERREAEDGTVQVRGTYDDGTVQDWVNAEDIETEEFSSLARDLEALLPEETPEERRTQIEQAREQALAEAPEITMSFKAGYQRALNDLMDKHDQEADTPENNARQQREIQELQEQYTQDEVKQRREERAAINQQFDQQLAELQAPAEAVTPETTVTPATPAEAAVPAETATLESTVPAEITTPTEPAPRTPIVDTEALSSPDPITKANAVFEAKQANPTSEQQKDIQRAERQLSRGKTKIQEKSNVLATPDDDVTTTDATETTELTEEQYTLLENADKTKDVVIITGTTRPTVTQDGKVQQTGRYEGIRIPADKVDAILAANAEKQKIRKPTNKAELTETLKQVFKLPADQADAAAEIIDRMVATMAKRAKKTKKEIYDTLRFQRGVDRKVPANAKAAMLKRGAMRIIAALQDPDVSSPLHELAHVFEDFLSPDEQTTVIKYAKSRGQKGDAWTRETSEAFAEGFERYLREGIAPSTGIQKIFDQFKDWIRTITSGVDVLNPQMREIYDLMLNEGQISRAAQITNPKKGSLATGRKAVKSNKAEVGDIVTHKGENWFVTAVDGDTYRLRSEDMKRTVNTKKFDEKLEIPREPIQDGDTVLFDGQEVKVTVTDKEYIIDGKQVGKNIKYKYPRNKLNDAMFNAAKERHAAQKQADDAKGEILFQTGTDLNTAIREFADKWIRANGSLSPAKFKRMLPAKVQKAVSDEDLRALFESTPAYIALQEKRKIQQQARGEASFGTEQRKSAERLIDKTDIDQATKDKVKARGLRYFTESVNQSEQQVLQWIETVGLDEATNMFLADSGRSDSFLDTMSGNDLPGHLQVFLGIELIRRHNELKDSNKAAEVAIRLAEIGTALGRGVNAFKGLTMLTAEGLSYAFGRIVNNAKEGLKEKYKNRIDQTVNKYNDAKAKAARDTASSLQTDKTWIQESKANILKALKGETDILFQTGIDSKVRADVIRFGMFLVLEGNTDFTKWSGKMKTQFGLTDAQTLEIWDSKYDGVNTVRDLGTNPHFANAVVNNIDSPKALTDFFDSVGVYQGNKLAESLNKAYKQRTAREFSKRANKAEKAFVQILASGDELDVTKIQEGYIAAGGFVGIDAELEALIQKTNEILTKSPTYAMKEAAVQKLMNEAFKKMGREPVGKYAMAAMYFNMLVGLPTHLTNLYTSVVQGIEDIVGQSFLAPLIDLVTRGDSRLRLLTPVRSNAGEVARATRLGARLGLSNAKDILFSGRLTQVQGQKYELPNIPERFSWASDVLGNLNKMVANVKSGDVPAAFSDLLKSLVGGYFVAAKINARAMDAADALTRTPTMVGYYVVASEHLASREFVDSGPMYQEVVSDLQARGVIQGDPRSKQNEPIVRKAIADRIRGWASGDVETLWTKLRQQVEDELKASGLPFTPQDVDNGTMERFAPDYRVKDIAERRANRTVFRQKPEGTIGVVAEALNSLSRKFPPTSLVVPFTSLLANVTNTWLDYFPPVAVLRAVGWNPSAVANRMFGTGIPTTNIQGAGKFSRDIEEQIIRRNELIYRATVGMVAGIVAALALGGEDEDGYPYLNGGGPKDYKKKKELESRGYAWYSVRVPGVGYVSYQYLPVGAVLSFVGNYFDIQRYGTEKEKEGAMASAVVGFPSFVMNATFIAGLADFFKTIQQSDKFTTAESVASTLSRQLSKFVPFNAMLNNAEAAMGYDQPELVGWQMTFRAIPFIRGVASDRPSLDHFGRPISKQVQEGLLGNALYHFVGTKRFYKPNIELDATEKLFQEKKYYTPEITGAFTINKVPIESDPILEYDVHKYTQRLFKQQADALAQNYATLSEEDFEKAMDKIHKNCREVIRQSFMQGMTPSEIGARYGLEDVK